MSKRPFGENIDVTLEELRQAVSAGCARVRGVEVDEVLSSVYVYFAGRLAREPGLAEPKQRFLGLVRLNAKQQAWAMVKASKRAQGAPADLNLVAANNPGAGGDQLPVRSCDEAAALLTMLPPETRETFRRLCNGETIEQVMRDFGVSNATVRRRNYAARKKLLSLLSIGRAPGGNE